jgi:carboxyl-terminal processing protease
MRVSRAIGELGWTAPAAKRRIIACLFGLMVQAPDVSRAQVDPEAIKKMETEGLFFSPPAPSFSTIQSYKAYLISKDPYADFLSREEYAQFKSAQAESHAGIGLELERDSNGAILCYPDPDGPAARAGISPAETLLAIDGHAVQGQPLPTLVALASGPPGSRLVIDVANRDKRVRQLSLVRTLAVGPSVTERRSGAYQVIRIGSFTPNTRQELEFILSSRSTHEPLILDLRGNRGGDLNAAIDCAMLFIPRGELVVSVVGKTATQRYVSTLEKPPYPQVLFLWQDHGTASSAELFVAALKDSGRALSIGTPTYGKGTVQSVIVLSSGAVLIISTAHLRRPNGEDIDGRGVAPGTVIPGAGTDQQYLDAVIHRFNRIR